MKRALMLLTLSAVSLRAATHTASADDSSPPAPVAPGAAPAEAKHTNKVSDAAKVVFQRISKAAGCPFGKGLKSASGVLSTAVESAPMEMKFMLAAPAKVRVETDPSWKDDAAALGAATRRATEAVLRMGCGVFEPDESAEFDADVAKAEGREVLAVTTFEKNAETSRTESVLDANGLMTSSSMRRQESTDGKKREVKTDAAYVWSKVGDFWRLDRITTGTGIDRSVVDVTYVDAAGRRLPLAWRIECGKKLVDVRMTELTVDGVKIDTSRLGATPDADKAAHARPLGDLGAYDVIAKDVLKMAESGDLSGAKARMKDVETAWDEAEAKMKPKSPSDWETLDKAIDKALASLRSKTPEKTGCVSALKALIATIDRMQ